MPRKLKTLAGPTKLSRVLGFLTRDPKPTLNAVQSLRLTYAARNNHWGARCAALLCLRAEVVVDVHISRHFVKQDLPRIQYANPNVNITVNKVQVGLEDVLHPELVIERRMFLLY
jgi:small subunit ribosomal protein S25